MAHTIIRCSKKDSPNWSGKEWSKLPAKIYSSQDDAMDALKSYWFGGYNNGTYDHRPIILILLTENKMQKLIQAGKARL